MLTEPLLTMNSSPKQQPHSMSGSPAGAASTLTIAKISGPSCTPARDSQHSATYHLTGPARSQFSNHFFSASNAALPLNCACSRSVEAEWACDSLFLPLFLLLLPAFLGVELDFVSRCVFMAE